MNLKVKKYLKISLNKTYITSLCWDGNMLIDWLTGDFWYDVEKNQNEPKSPYTFAYPFDAVIASQNYEYHAAYRKLDTKGIIRKSGKPTKTREINRSFYRATGYEYPITFIQLPDGRTGLIHCPNAYNKLEIEIAETGETLTARDNPTMDFFHSRLAANPEQTHFMSAGWIWHPFDEVYIYNLEEVLANPEQLDQSHSLKLTQDGVEINMAAFLENNQLILTTSDVWYDPDEPENDLTLLGPDEIALIDFQTKEILSRAKLEEPTGTLMPINAEYAIGFYQNPKAIHIPTGKVVHTWTEIQSGKQQSSHYFVKNVPPMALDSQGKRFAILSDDIVHVVMFD